MTWKGDVIRIENLNLVPDNYRGSSFCRNFILTYKYALFEKCWVNRDGKSLTKEELFSSSSDYPLKNADREAVKLYLELENK